jgi:signal peptidase I
MTQAVVPETQTTTSAPTEPAPVEQAEPRRRGTDWWGEIKGILWLLLVVLGFHSFIAKPFYIPSESMLPGMLVGDRLVVTKFAYGWSFVSPTIPNPAAIFRSVVLRQPGEGWTVALPPSRGRLLGRLPERGDVVIVTPPGTRNDYIKRVIGLPGDLLEVRGGTVILNGKPVRRGPIHEVDIADYGGTLAPDGTETCDSGSFGTSVRRPAGSGAFTCRLPVVTETLPNGRRYDTIELGATSGDDYGPIRIPANHVFLMGDNRDRSADSRFELSQQGLGGPVPYENIGGRAEFITFSLDGSTTWNPITWITSLRGGRAGTSLHAETAP